MPKKNDELKAEAKRLYEQEGFSLVDIARKLNINPNTVKSWKKRDGWIAPQNAPTKLDKGAKKKVQNPNSLANLIPPAEPGNKRAQKHGLYADNSNEPGYEEHLDEVSQLTDEQVARKVVDMALANMLTAMESFGAGSPQYFEAFARVATMISGMAEKPSKIRSNEIRNQIDEYRLESIRQDVTGDNEILEKIDSWIDELERDAYENNPEAEDLHKGSQA